MPICMRGHQSRHGWRCTRPIIGLSDTRFFDVIVFGGAVYFGAVKRADNSDNLDVTIHIDRISSRSINRKLNHIPAVYLNVNLTLRVLVQ